MQGQVLEPSMAPAFNLADLPDLARHHLVKAMDSDTRAAFCLACMRTLNDVHAATTRLTWEPEAHIGDASIVTDKGFEYDHDSDHLPVKLLAKCPALTHLVLDGLDTLENLQGLPRNLLHLDLSRTAFPNSDLLCLSALSTLQELHLARTYLKAAATVLATILPTLRCLRVLDLAHCCLCNNGAHALAQGLKYVPTLQDLDLRHNDLGAFAAEALAPALSNLVQLTSLTLANNGFLDGAAAALAPALRLLTRLVKLDFSGNQLRDSAAALAPALAGLVQLTELKLADCELGRGAIVALSTSVCCLTQLQHLDFNHNELGASVECACALKHMVEPLRQLRTFDLWEAGISEEVYLPVLAPALAQMPHMQLLLLLDAWPSQVLSSLQVVLAGQRNLTCLEFFTTGLTEDDAAALAGALLPLSRLQRLVLMQDARVDKAELAQERRAPPAAFLRLFDAIAQLTTLERINLACNRFGDEGLAALTGRVLPALRRLTHLDLSDTALGYEGAVLLAPALGGLHKLRKLHLRINGFGQRAVEVLARVVRGLACLRLLALGSNHVADHVLSDLFLQLQL